MAGCLCFQKSVPSWLSLRPFWKGLAGASWQRVGTTSRPRSICMAGGCLGFSFVRFYENRLIGFFHSQGLVQRVIEIDDDTSISIWLPQLPGSQRRGSESNKKKMPVLLLHGFGASAIWQWSGQLRVLSAHCDVYMPDLIFFGGSTSRSPERSEIFQADCILKLMTKLGVERFDVVGISYGGFVGYRIATMEPQRVDQLVLTDAGILMTPRELSLMLERWGVADAGELLLPTTTEGVAKLLHLAFYKSLPMPRFLLEDALQCMFTDMVEEKRGLLQDLVRHVGYPEGHLPVPPQETLLIWGDNDEVFPVAIGRRMQEYFGKRAKLVIVKKANHMCNAERIEEYNKALMHFLYPNVAP